MNNNYWLLPAVGCLIAWGISRFFPKLATNHIDPKSAFIYEVSGEMLVAFAMLAYLGFRPAFDIKGSGFAIAAGIFGAVGVYLFLLAAQRGNVSQIVTVTAFYPIITVALGFFLLDEPLTIKQMVGIALAMVAVVLVST